MQDDFLGDLGECSAPLFVLTTLAVLDIGPFGMTRHDDFLNADNKEGAILPVAANLVRLAKETDGPVAPGFFLALTGTLFSLLTLGLVRHLPARWFGPVSLSVFAAFAHIGGQLLLARLWLIPHDGVFLLTPVFAAAALIFGTINGLITAKLLAEPTEPQKP